jgi:putative membrane protein
MTIDYVTLLLINVAAGLAVLAGFLWWGLTSPNRASWAPAFGICGLVATVGGLAMSFTWPIPAPFGEIYGQSSTLLGVLFLGAAWSLARGWHLLPLAIYAFFSGAMAIVIGVRVIALALVPNAMVPGVGFILTGLAGLSAGLALYRPQAKLPRLLGALELLAAAAIWSVTGYYALWMHMGMSVK